MTNLAKKIQGLFTKRARAKGVHNAFLLVHSDKFKLHLNLAEGKTGQIPASPQQQYFIASIGKLFTSVTIARLAEEGKLQFSSPVMDFLEEDLLAGLHVYKGRDYTGDITLGQLLNHTSGLMDYFSDKPKGTVPFLDLIFQEPQRFWTPQEVIRWSKAHLKTHFPPGKGFHYSDTGYHLLGLVVEKVTGLAWHEAVHAYIFAPLGMKHSFCPFYSQPQERQDLPVADLIGRGVRVNDFQSLSVDYAGGGIVSTGEDLLKFMQALAQGRLISQDTFRQMEDWGKFDISIDYGYGMMKLKTLPLIMPPHYNAWGNAGSVGSFMFYNPGLDTYVIGSLNQFGYARKGIMLMLKVFDILNKA